MEHTSTFATTFAELVAKGVIPNREKLSAAAEADRQNNIEDLSQDREQRGQVSQIRKAGLEILASIHERAAATLPKFGNPFAISFEDPGNNASIQKIDQVYTIRQAWEQFVLRAVTGLALADPDKLDEFLCTDPNEISSYETQYGKAFLYELGCAIRVDPLPNLSKDTIDEYSIKCSISQRLASISNPDEVVNPYPRGNQLMLEALKPATYAPFGKWNTNQMVRIIDLFERCGFTIHPQSTDA